VDSGTLKTYESRLLDLRERISSLEDTRRESGKTVELDQARTGRLSRMDALQLQAMARAGQGRAAAELKRIDAALARIRAGAYGDCLECGAPIAPGRLEAQPAATLCVSCAEARERR
jgi:DnaK suppressor protein